MRWALDRVDSPFSHFHHKNDVLKASVVSILNCQPLNRKTLLDPEKEPYTRWVEGLLCFTLEAF